ncbi:MAG: CRISPR-associated helicase Cas3' [Spirochaetes bacterium]|nr:CRISPR-associated helicase Cas3' [Spirochaetota bacterium]
MNFSFFKCNSHPGRLLTDHIISVANFIDKFWPVSKNNLKSVAIVMGLTHDLGKATQEFQNFINADESERWKFEGHQKDHSLLSSALTLPISIHILRNQGIEDIESSFISLLSALCVRKHHGDINLEMDGYIAHYLSNELIEECTPTIIEERLPLSDIISWLNTVIPSMGITCPALSRDIPLNEKELEYLLILSEDFRKSFFSCKQSLLFLNLFSMLIGADKLDATFSGSVPDLTEIPMLSTKLVENYRVKVFKKAKTRMDQLRSEISSRIKEMVSINLNRNLFTITSPTGSGKTLAAFDAALRFAEVNKKSPIIYCLPFTSIIDQNYEQAVSIFRENHIIPTEDLLLRHHHLTPIAYKKCDGTNDSDEWDIDKQEMLVETWQSRFIITTFVQLFETIFSGRNRALKKLFLVPESVVILDEIQAIPRKFWGLIKETARILSEDYGTCFILMTATQPGIFLDLESLELLPESHSYFQRLSRTALEVDISHEITIENLAEKISLNFRDNPHQSIIAIVNTVNDSVNLYKKIRHQLPDAPINYLSSNIIPIERRERLQCLKKSESWILISTQVIEAGVDISADIVHRDFAPLDSIVQAAGRCNRNDSGQSGKVHIWKIKEEGKTRTSSSMIYDSVLLNATEEVLKKEIKYEEKIKESELIMMVKEYFKLVWSRGSDNDTVKFLKEFDFENLARHGQLIANTKGENRYFVIRQKDPLAKDLWLRFEKILEIKDFREKRKEFQKIKPDFFSRIISVREPLLNEKIECIYEPDDYIPDTGYVKRNKENGYTII